MWGGQTQSGEVVPVGEAGGAGLCAAVDCKQHPRHWHLPAIAALLDEVVNTSASDSAGVLQQRPLSWQ